MTRVLDRLSSPVLDAVADLPGVWVVGGAVRDTLLGREVRELDLLVEGDAALVARRLGEPVAVHERFGTYTVGGVDVVSARTEAYPQPGALPEVTLGATVAEDLRRRDFTVNALAVRLADGHLEALPETEADLEAGRLRVLHERSFLDDPTRLVRMARYAARLGFVVEPETARLAREALATGALATVSGARLGAELRRLLAEPLPEALLQLEEHGIGAHAIHPAFAADPALLRGVVEAAPPGAHPGLAALGACLLYANGVPAVLNALAFPTTERAIVAAAASAQPLAAALGAAASPSEVAAIAARQPGEALAVAAALGAGDVVERWLGEWRHVRLAITGEDLLDAGLEGPAVGAALRAAHAAALDGDAEDREAQLAAALEAAR